MRFSLCAFLLPPWFCLCLCQVGGKTYHGTKNVTITRQCASDLGNYSAINVTLSLSESDLKCDIRFTPAICHSADSDYCNPRSDRKSELLRRKIKNAFKTTQTAYDLSKFPDLSLWTDRSILIAGFHRWNLTVDESVCPNFRLCPFPSPVLPGVPLDECYVELGEVMGNCRAGTTETHYYLFPLATGISIQVRDTQPNPNKIENSFNFVVTPGYRLGPGNFTCPQGLSACDPFINPLEYRLNWTYRICLPQSLWCDGVPNCPYSKSDEQNCGANRSHNMPPTSFPLDPVLQAQELDMLDRLINKYHHLEFLFDAGHMPKPNRWLALSHAQLVSLILTCLIGLGILIALALFFILKKVKRLPSESLSNGESERGDDGHKHYSPLLQHSNNRVS